MPTPWVPGTVPPCLTGKLSRARGMGPRLSVRLEAGPGRRDETTAVVTRMGRGSGDGFEVARKPRAVSPLTWFWILRVASMRWVR